MQKQKVIIATRLTQITEAVYFCNRVVGVGESGCCQYALCK